MHTLTKWARVPGRSPEDRRLKTHTHPEAGTFGRLVRDHRHDLDISQAALAARMGVHYSYISRIESNDRAVDKLSTLLALADALELGKAQTLELLWAAATREAGA